MVNGDNMALKQWNLDDYPSICSTYEYLLLECKLQDGEVICGCGTSCGNDTDGVFKHLLTHMPPTSDKSAMVKSADKV
jgi:hypothetical protein